MIGRQPVGTVVEIDGSLLLLNLFEEARGHVVGHPDGVSAVGQPGDLIGVEGGSEIIIARVLSIAYAEPRELYKPVIVRSAIGEPLRQMRCCVIGLLRRVESSLLFVPQDAHLPALGAGAFPLSEAELTSTIGDQGPEGDRVLLGQDARAPLISVAANVNDLLSRHVAVLGGTGQGKTHFVAALLQRITAMPCSRVIIFDVNGEYSQAFSGPNPRVRRSLFGILPEAERGGSRGQLRLPYYALGRHGLARLLLPSERTQAPALRFAIEHLRFIRADRNGARAHGYDENVFFDDCRQGREGDANRQLNDLRSRNVAMAAEWPHMRGLSCLVAEFGALRVDRGGDVRRDAFAYGNVHSLVNRVRSLIEDERFREVVDVHGGVGVGGTLDLRAEAQRVVGDIFGSPQFLQDDWNVHIVDLSKLAQDLMPFVLGSLLELYASELFWRGPGMTHPTLLVLEEAHHYLRQLPGDQDSGQHSLAYERLAKEGRKFGVSLMISTQRPSEVSATVLAQCGTWAVFRLSNDSDQRAVAAAAEAVASNVTRQIPGLARGEAIVFGAAMPVATRINVIRAEPPPTSFDPPFLGAWRTSH